MSAPVPKKPTTTARHPNENSRVVGARVNISVATRALKANKTAHRPLQEEEEEEKKREAKEAEESLNLEHAPSVLHSGIISLAAPRLRILPSRAPSRMRTSLINSRLIITTRVGTRVQHENFGAPRALKIRE